MTMGQKPGQQSRRSAKETPPDEQSGKTSPMVNHDELREWIAAFSEEALLADGFEEAIIGVAERCSKPPLVVYDADKCIEILMQRDGMEHDEAEEFFQFNTLGAWMGENTPLFLWKYEPDTGPFKLEPGA
jgi:hypothetical protein